MNDLRKKTPCPSCCQNLKAFQAKVKVLEVKMCHLEKSRDTHMSKCIELAEKNQRLSERNLEFRDKLGEMEWKLTVFDQPPLQTWPSQTQ